MHDTDEPLDTIDDALVATLPASDPPANTVETGVRVRAEPAAGGPRPPGKPAGPPGPRPILDQNISFI